MTAGTGIGENFALAGQMQTGVDGGNHPLFGDVLRCIRCGALLLSPGQRAHDEHHEIATGSQEHVVQLSAADRMRLLRWLGTGSGSETLGRVTFESVAGGGLLIRTRPWKSPG